MLLRVQGDLIDGVNVIFICLALSRYTKVGVSVFYLLSLWGGSEERNEQLPGVYLVYKS